MLRAWLLLIAVSGASFSLDCHPKIDVKQKQFIIGYGSFMLENSRNFTCKNISKNQPMWLNGYQRGWFAHGLWSSGKPATFLGLKHDLTADPVNAVYFQVKDPKQLVLFDAREKWYCRELVSPKQRKVLSVKKAPLGQYWVYVQQPKYFGTPDAHHPIYPEYVGIFVLGCYQTEKQCQVPGFALQCLQQTHHWP